MDQSESSSDDSNVLASRGLYLSRIPQFQLMEFLAILIFVFVSLLYICELLVEMLQYFQSTFSAVMEDICQYLGKIARIFVILPAFF